MALKKRIYLLNDTYNSSYYIASNYMTGENESKSMWKKVVVASFEALPQHLSGELKKATENLCRDS
jgi:hypothetical protein